ncbi:MAG: hypothetical protein U0414_19730 [Polyangiaceae bacterium]
MASVMAVVSKKVFETDARDRGKVLGLGGVWPTEIYKSTHASLRPLGEGGHLFLVTVRPPDEALWLVAVLRDPKLVAEGWRASPNTAPAVDVSALKSKLRFATGTGITAEKGKLGMSLQTPRTLTPADEALFLAAAGAPAPSGAPAAPPKKTYHLNRHEVGPLPCLCMRCFAAAPERVELGGEVFLRRHATAKERILYHWLPEALQSSEARVRLDIERRMRLRLKDPVDRARAPARKRRPARDEDEGDDDE